MHDWLTHPIPNNSQWQRSAWWERTMCGCQSWKKQQQQNRTVSVKVWMPCLYDSNLECAKKKQYPTVCEIQYISVYQHIICHNILFILLLKPAFFCEHLSNYTFSNNIVFKGLWQDAPEDQWLFGSSDT